MAAPVAIRCAAVEVVEAGSSRTSAAPMSAPPATTSADRTIADRCSANARAKQLTAIRPIATSTIQASGIPGTASRLTVRVTGS
ncbi:MAG TPA: hypothetical protein VN906_05750 [Candidatus Sulfotelmatobacter sp.]|nr:hypothetical protein [Candidatus Sulfotelmatobacter sp.]